MPKWGIVAYTGERDGHDLLLPGKALRKRSSGSLTPMLRHKDCPAGGSHTSEVKQRQEGQSKCGIGQEGGSSEADDITDDIEGEW